MSAHASGLKRELSFLDLTMASMGGIIGSGWLFGAMIGANIAGPAAIVSWIIGGIAVLVIGLVFAELGGALPQAGGIVRYPQYSHGPFVSVIMGMAAVVAYASVPPIEALAAIQYGAYYAPGLFVNGSATGLGLFVAALLMVLFFFLNYYGVKFFARVNTPWTLLKTAIPVLAIIVIVLTTVHGGNFTAQGGFMPYGASSVLSAVPLGGIVFSYLGFRQALDLAGEAKNPQRDVPRAVITAILIGIVVYVLLQVVFIGGLPASTISGGWAKLSLTSPFADLAVALGLGWLSVILFADAIWSPTGTGNVYFASTSRIMYALTNNRYFPKAIGKVSKVGVPWVALIVTFVVGLIFLLPFPAWSKLVGIVSAATVFTYMIGPVSAAVLRRTMPDLHRPFTLKALGFWAPLAFVIGSLIIYWTGWATDSVILLVVLVLVVAVAIYTASSKEADKSILSSQNLRAGTWLIVYMLVLLALTYFGSANFGAPDPVIAFPLDLVVVIIVALAFYYWGVSSGYRTVDAESHGKEEAVAGK